MRLKLFITLIIIAFTKVTFSQNSSIKGKIIDEKTGEVLPGAIVVIKGTTTGAAADFDGLFTIKDVPPGTYVLECSNNS